MGIGNQAELEAMCAADPDCPVKRTFSHYNFYRDDDVDRWKKRKTLVGNGQCPVLTQVATGAPVVSLWHQGPKVKGNLKIPRGTAIATFFDGKYPNKASGNHVAIYLDQDAKGIRVLDQWSGKAVEDDGFERVLKFSYKGALPESNSGNFMSVVLTLRIINYDERECTRERW